MSKKFGKMFSNFEIVAYEVVALNCLYSEENTCHRHSMC